MRLQHIATATLLTLLPLGCAHTSPATPPPADDSGPSSASPAPESAPTAATAGPDAIPMAPADAMSADAVLTNIAQQEAPGAQPVGSTFAGQFVEGQTLEQTINLQPGRCYTIVAGTMGGVEELHIVLQQPMGGLLPPAILAQDDSTGPSAVVGGKASGCWKNSMAIAAPGQVILRVSKGSGIAAAKVYVK